METLIPKMLIKNKLYWFIDLLYYLAPVTYFSLYCIKTYLHFIEMEKLSHIIPTYYAEFN